MEPIEVLGVEHIDVTVNDLARSAIFYDKVMPALGFRRLLEDDSDKSDGAMRTSASRFGKPRPPSAARRSIAIASDCIISRSRLSARDAIDEFHRFLIRENLPVLDAPAEYPQYGANYYAVFFADPDGMKLELVHFPWGYWRTTQRDGSDARPRSQKKD